MKRIWKSIVLAVIIVMSICGIASAATTIKTDVTTASSGCTLAGLQGQYIADCQAALNRINEIRLEACKEGVRNPANPSKKLTMKDYKPLKWSSDMEEIARIRAAESSITMDHVRTNGKSCFAIKSSSKITSSCEVIAWNFSKSMTLGIEQWYGEKKAWVNKTGGVTGHYEAMIDPTFNYVGLGTFYSTKVKFYNTTVGEFSASTKTLKTTFGKSTGDVIQTLEVKNTILNQNKASFVKTTATVQKATVTSKTKSAVKTTGVQVNKKSLVLKKGTKATLKVTISPKNSTEKVTYTTSNKNVATVDTNGNIKAVKAGKATITVQSGSIKVNVAVVVK